VFGGAWKADLASWEIPESPGLGVDFSVEFLREHQVKLDRAAG
jgi:hypothetical protein